MKSPVTTHILDTSIGKPAVGVRVHIEYLNVGWSRIGEGITDQDGRITDLLSDLDEFKTGEYKITFRTAEYFLAQNIESFYPQVELTFSVKNTEEHYHVPLLLNPYGFSTYRGS